MHQRYIRQPSYSLTGILVRKHPPAAPALQWYMYEYISVIPYFLSYSLDTVAKCAKSFLMSLRIPAEYQDQFLEEMNGFNPNHVYPVQSFANLLGELGVEGVGEDNDGLVFGEVRIAMSNPDWGEPGISPGDVLSAVIDAHGFVIATRMTGTGFRYRDCLEKLAAKWGITKSYM